MLVSAPWRQGAEAVSSWQVSAQREQLTEFAGSREHSRALAVTALQSRFVHGGCCNSYLPQNDAAYPAVEM